MNWVFLWKADVFAKDFTFCEYESLPKTGFQSLYSIPEQAADDLIANGTFAGYKGTVNSTLSLWVDLDGEHEAQVAVEILKDLGLEFKVWTTGNRGLHLEIARAKEITGETVHLTDRAWVKRTIPGADTSIYAPIHAFRRPGMIHKATGKAKAVLTHYKGRPLDLDLLERKKDLVTIVSTKSIFEDPYIMALSAPLYDGERHEGFLRLARRLATYGATEDFIFEWIFHVNLLGDQWDADKLKKIAKWAVNAQINK